MNRFQLQIQVSDYFSYFFTTRTKTVYHLLPQCAPLLLQTFYLFIPYQFLTHLVIYHIIDFIHHF